VPPLPLALVDLRPDLTRPDEARGAAELLAEAGTGGLIGDHLDDPTPHPPSAVAAVLAPLLPIVSTVTCRGRSRVELEAELIAMWNTGVLAVHCVTGDHPRSRLHLALDPPFGADSLEMSAWAAGVGMAVSVAESPAAPPQAWRPVRVREKARAGAGVVILNHAGPVDALIGFVDACRDLGVTVPFVAPVPVITDHRSAEALRRFPGLVLPPGLLEAVLGAADPVSRGIEAAIEIGRHLLGSGRFAAVNLSGSASAGGMRDRARIMAAIAKELAA
jgi:5,10-methylenetetrahydrofolate reductase